MSERGEPASDASSCAADEEANETSANAVSVEGSDISVSSRFESPVNIGNPIEHTVLDLAERVLRLTGSRSRLERRPLPPDDPKRRCPDISRAKRHLQWEPKVSLDDGLRETIGRFRRELGMSSRMAA